MTDCPADVLSGLRRIPGFRGAPEAVLRRLAAAARVFRPGRHDTLFQRGDPCEGLLVLLQGQAKVYARADRGHEKVIEVVSAPDCLGESTLIGEACHRVNAAMLSEGRVALLPQAALMREVGESPVLAMHLLADVTERLNRRVHDLEAVTLHTAAQRVVSYLLQDNAPQRASLAPVQAAVGPCTVSLPASKGTIASLLSVTPEHFSRILHDLQSRGLIAVNRREIHIPDVQRLACHA
jgi:CRP/FNR family transcriptional regulator, dissimilatory nitrate respiration regulator